MVVVVVVVVWVGGMGDGWMDGWVVVVVCVGGGERMCCGAEEASMGVGWAFI